MAKPTKHPPPLGLDMDPDEALERFIGTDPGEVDALEKRAKAKKPPGRKKKPGGKKPPGSSSENVVSLRDRRMRKRNYGR
jgi:hypothetical protein